MTQCITVILFQWRVYY